MQLGLGLALIVAGLYSQVWLVFVLELKYGRMYLQAALVLVQAVAQYFLVVGISALRFRPESKLVTILGLRVFEQKSQDFDLYVNLQQKDVQALTELQALRGGISESTRRDIENLNK